MKVTVKGQVTIPREIREKMGIRAHSEVEFVEDRSGRVYLRKLKRLAGKDSRFRTASGAGRLKMSTDEIMALTRG